MATLIKQFTFVADTDILPNQVNANFDDIVAFLNNSVVHVDGSKAMTGALVLPAADPTTANQASRKSYVDSKASAAQTAATTVANNAQTTANTANGKADTALHRIPNLIRWGAVTGTTNGAGDISFAHTLGVVPVSVVVTPVNSTADMDWHPVIENSNSTTTVNVRIHNTNNGAAMGGIGVTLFWMAGA